MDPRSTYVNPLLTDLYVGYSSGDFVAEKFFPTVTVEKETGTYFVRDKENLRAPADARRGDLARANRVQNSLTSATFALEEKSLEHAIPDRVLRNYADPFDPKKNGTMLVTEKLKLDNEKDLKTTLLAQSSQVQDISAAWIAGFDIQGQIRAKRTAIQKATGRKPNQALMGPAARDALLNNTAFKTSIQYVQVVNDANLLDALAKFLGVDGVTIGEAIENTSKEGQADSLDYIWKNELILAYVNPNPAIEDTSLGYRLQQRNVAAVDEWYEQQIKSTFVRATDFYDNYVVDPNCMWYFTNVA